MGECSEYFEDFPEENPANWVNGRFDPAAAARQRAIEEGNRKVAMESQDLQRKIFKMAEDAKQKAKQRESENSNGANEDTGL